MAEIPFSGVDDAPSLAEDYAEACAAIKRVIDLHSPDKYGDCPACGLTADEEAIPWVECRTIAVLQGNPDPPPNV